MTKPWLNLPTSTELPCSDDIPVDNEDQNFIPNFLLFLLEFIWASRKDWFWGYVSTSETVNQSTNA